MKKITVSLLITSSLVFGAFHPDLDQTDSEVYIENQVVVNEIIGGTSKVEFIDSDKEVGVGAKFINVGDINILNFPLNYSLDSNYALELNFPLVSNRDSVAGERWTGVGDISFGANYHTGSALDERGSNISTITYKSTTGSDSKGIGAAVTSLTFSHRIARDYDEMIRLYGFASYTLSNTADSTMLMFGGSRPCLLNDKLTTNIKLTYFHIDSLVTLADTEVDTLDLWASWTSKKLVDGLPLGFGFKLPLINTRGGDSQDKTILFYLSASSFFDN